jgi:hypothetical protein
LQDVPLRLSRLRRQLDQYFGHHSVFDYVVDLVVAAVFLGAIWFGGATHALGLYGPTVRTVTKTVPAPPTPASGYYDIWRSYEHKPSYAGPLGTARLKAGSTYYVPSDANLVQDGNGEWFILDTNTPVLSRAADAGRYPFKLTLVDYSNWDYESTGDSILVITLPTRPDFYPTEPTAGQVKWAKTISPYSYERFFRRKSTRRRDPHKTRWYDFIDLPILDGAAELWFLLAVAVAVAIFALIGWPLLLLLSDFIWLIIVLVGALISFGIFGRPVTIVANNGDKTHTWKIRGLLKAQRLRQKIADNLAHGIVLEG